MAAKELCATMGGFEGGEFNFHLKRLGQLLAIATPQDRNGFVGGALSVYPLVIPGRAKREPGIHNHDR